MFSLKQCASTSSSGLPVNSGLSETNFIVAQGPVVLMEQLVMQVGQLFVWEMLVAAWEEQGVLQEVQLGVAEVQVVLPQPF